MIRLVLALLLAGTAQAQDTVDGLKHPFHDPFIEQLTGDWTLTRQIRGKQATNTVHAEWVLNHQFLELHMKDIAQPPAYEALVYIGYQNADQRYVAHWMDVWGGKFSAIGYGRRTGDSIEFAFQYDDGPFFNTFAWDGVAHGWTFKMESSDKEGTRSPFAVDTLRRK